MLTPANEEIIEEGEEKSNLGMKISYNFLCSEWYNHIVHCLCFLSCPQLMDRKRYIALKIKAQPHVIVEGILYWMDPLGILLLCLAKEKSIETIKYYHEKLCGEIIVGKILHTKSSRRDCLGPPYLVIYISLSEAIRSVIFLPRGRG